MVDNHRGYQIYLSGNPSSPPLLLLHGFTGSHASWNSIVPGLTQKYWIIVPDLPGHGESFVTANRRDMALDVTAQDLAKILRDLGVKKSGVLGYSMGGRLALHLGLYASSLVEFLILESTTAGIEDTLERSRRRYSDDDLAAQIDARGLEWFVQYWGNLSLFATQNTLPPAVLEHQRQIRLSHKPYGLAQSLRAAGAGQQASLWPILPYYRAPTLIIAGQHDDKYRTLGEKLHRLLPMSDLVVVDGAGHTVHLEQPEHFLSAVKHFNPK